MTALLRRSVVVLGAFGLATCAAPGCGGRVFGSSDGGSGGSSGSEASGEIDGDTGASGSLTGAGGSEPAGSLPSADRTLDSLDENELRAVCLEEARRSDPCMTRGMMQNEQSACEAVVAECIAGGGLDETTTCDAVRSIECPVTVDQFFLCIDAWNATQTCDDAGVYLEAPEPCEALKACEPFRYAFEQTGWPKQCDSSSAPERPDTGDDIYGADGCYPVPDRMIVLGNSVIGCDGDEPDGYGCGPEMLAAHIRANYSPDLEYENIAAIESSGFETLLQQAERAGPTNGHVLVWISSLPGNIDPQALELEHWRQQLRELMSYIIAEASAGATFLLNTQYSPSDQCPDAPWGFGDASLTWEEEEALPTLNYGVFTELALERADTIAIDQYPDWLGHGWNAGAEGCPHCYTDNTRWQYDPVHPNQLGQVHFFEKWRVAVDRMYGEDCP